MRQFTPFIVLPLLLSLAQAAETVVFKDSFDTQPDSSWHWLREDPPDWRVQHAALEIRIRPGDANTVRNALVRGAPDRRQGRFAIDVTVTSLKPPKQQFEQAGITWYTDGKPVFKLVKELVDGQLMIIPGRKPMTNDTVQLRLIVSGNAWTAQYRPGGKGEFQTAATGELPAPGADAVSIQCYHGPPDAEHWIRFDDFRVLRLED
jgi:regulation of enolase protein 1 (concanavalin A-like superfamily)